MCQIREEAATYIYDQDKWDSRRGLKRTWTSPSADMEAGHSSQSKTKPTAAEKGEKIFLINLGIALNRLISGNIRLTCLEKI